MADDTQNYILKIFIGQTSLDFIVNQNIVTGFNSMLNKNNDDWFPIENVSGKKTNIKLSSVVAYEVTEPVTMSSGKKDGLVSFVTLGKFFSVHPIRIKRNCKNIVTH